MGWLALGYFLSYIPYTMLVKALSSGVLPGTDAPDSGLVLLPAAAIGQLLVMPVFLGLSGWWRRYAGRREVLGRYMRFPAQHMWAAGFFTALIIATTTLNFTFAGVSILFMLLLMRGGVLILSPVVDATRRRRVRASSWVAVGFSLVAVAVTLADVTTYHLTIGAALSVAVYLAGYLGRFEIMSRVAKTGNRETDRRYFVEEHAAAPVCQVLLLAVAALAGHPQLRAGFTTFLGTPEAAAAAAIGVAYEVLFVFGTLIYLDRREYSWCVPANRCASLLSGLAASFALAWLAGLAAPGAAQLTALSFVVCAVAALSFPTLSRAGRRRLLLFVCGGNTSRSAMAESIARSELAQARTRWSTPRLRVASGGVAVTRPGAAMTRAARTSLAELGYHRAAARTHRARPVTPGLCRRSTAIYCMTGAQRDQVIALVPEVGGRVFCLDPARDIPDPAGRSAEVHRACAQHIQQSVRTLLHEQTALSALAPDSG
ncbi:hypothetical protein GCM10020367_11600 [Streptomyces sannanensis]|uniref:Phosphotyrosine protein phosphatase I domain-containing protein n=1 Tax=Streptomyces sannanensis TaxID=285536 RepID=A0ABP6S6E2_9ACTN